MLLVFVEDVFTFSTSKESLDVWLEVKRGWLEADDDDERDRFSSNDVLAVSGSGSSERLRKELLVACPKGGVLLNRLSVMMIPQEDVCSKTATEKRPASNLTLSLRDVALRSEEEQWSTGANVLSILFGRLTAPP